MAVAAALAMLFACDLSDEPPGHDAAVRIAKKLAFEAYPQWAMKPSNVDRCPTTADLAEYVPLKPDFTDPWGNPYIITCSSVLPAWARSIAVFSKGADGREGTADDQRSW